MYKYAATDSIFDGVSNLYLVSIATAFLAVIIAFYCSNLLKDESENQLQEVLDEVDGEEAEENYLNDATTEIENHFQLKQELQKRLKIEELENTSDYDDDDEEDVDNEVYKNEEYIKRNSTTNDSSDDMEDMHVDGLVSKLKTNRIKELEAQLTRDQLEEERRIEREQLAAIFELLKKQEAELNMKEIDETELNAQLGLYR